MVKNIVVLTNERGKEINRMNFINESIKNQSVKLVTDEGLKDLSLNDAILLAQELNMDLVEVSTTGIVSVCKLMDYSKHLYQQKKKDKSQPKKETLKEIKLGAMIAEHDLLVKAKSIERLVLEGHKVKIVILIKGNRGRDNIKIGLDLYTRVMLIIEDKVQILSAFKLEGTTGTFTVKGK